jgi:hypothetical protein
MYAEAAGCSSRHHSLDTQYPVSHDTLLLLLRLTTRFVPVYPACGLVLVSNNICRFADPRIAGELGRKLVRQEKQSCNASWLFP